jgi:plastocyanin
LSHDVSTEALTMAHSAWYKALFALWAAGTVCASSALTVQVEVQDDRGRPLQDAVVFLESREARALVKPVAGAEIAQIAKQFMPKVSVVTVGTAVQFPNRDTVRHHVYSFSPIKTFDLKLYIGTPSNPVLFDKAGVAVLGCNIHDTMAAWVLVVETPYYGLTAGNGRVSLEQVPPGAYRLRTWHPGMPIGAAALDQPYTITAGNSPLTVRIAGITP